MKFLHPFRIVFVSIFFLFPKHNYSQIYWNKSHLVSASVGLYNLFPLIMEAEIKDRHPFEYKVTPLIPPLHFKYEYFFSRKFSLGLELNYTKAKAIFSKEDYNFSSNFYQKYSYSVSSSNPAFAPFISVHSNNKKVSPFFSFGIQWNMISDKLISTDDPAYDKRDYSTFDESPARTFYLQLGIKWMITDYIGVGAFASYLPSVFAISAYYRFRNE